MHPRHLDLNLLPVLDALLSERNVTRAAARVHLSQSAVSHALARLRTLFADPLLVRAGRGMLLTPRGERLARKVAEYVQRTEALLADEEQFHPGTHAQTFTLAVTDYVEWLLLPRLVEHLREFAPEVRLRTRPLQTSQLDFDLSSGRIDLAIGFIPKPHPGIHTRALFREQFTCVVGARSTWARTRLTMKNYLAAAHIQISPDGLFSGPPDVPLAALGYARNVVVSTPRWVSAYHYLTRSDLVLTTQTTLARMLSASLPVLVVPAPFAIPAGQLLQIWHPRTNADAAQQWLRALVLQVANGARSEADEEVSRAAAPGRAGRR